MAETPKPLAQGDLRKSPLVHVVASLHRKTASGTLVIWPESADDAQARVRFEAGLPVAARAGHPGSLAEVLEHLAGRAGGAYAFYGEDLVGAGGVTGTPAFSVLLRRLVHATRRDDGLARLLASRGEAPLRVRRGLTPDGLGLDREETEVLEVLRAAPVSAPELATRSGRPEVARRLIYLLELLGALESMDDRGAEPSQRTRTTEAGAAPAAPPKPRVSSPPPQIQYPDPPQGLSEADRARWDEVVARAKAEDAQTLYELLGVPPQASTQDVESAYVRMAKLVHPDRLGSALAPLRAHADRIFRRATEARAVLVDAESRADYDRQVAEGGGTPAAERHVREVIEAALEFQKVDLLLRKRLYDAAIAILDRNMELSPEVAEYPAKKAYALLLAHGIDDRATRDRILALLDHALGLDPRHEAAHFTKGQVLKKMGDPRAALAHFRAAAEANPHNIDAAREVRLATMKKSESGSSDGLLGRLFKKKP